MTDRRRVEECMARHAAGKPPIGELPVLSGYLHSGAWRPERIIETDDNPIVLDLGKHSDMLRGRGNPDVTTLGRLIDEAMLSAGTRFAFGRYGEDRDLYGSDNFADPDSGERRSVHLGVDVFCEAGTVVSAPLDGEVEIFAEDAAELGYGPMLILRHQTDNGLPFFTLYGHLDHVSVAQRRRGDPVHGGQSVAAVGSPPRNGNWPPHLHFQIILDLLDLAADFPGVAVPSQRNFWCALSPSPARFFPECPASELACDETASS